MDPSFYNKETVSKYAALKEQGKRQQHNDQLVQDAEYRKEQRGPSMTEMRSRVKAGQEVTQQMGKLKEDKKQLERTRRKIKAYKANARWKAQLQDFKLPAASASLEEHEEVLSDIRHAMSEYARLTTFFSRLQWGLSGVVELNKMYPQAFGGINLVGPIALNDFESMKRLGLDVQELLAQEADEMVIEYDWLFDSPLLARLGMKLVEIGKFVGNANTQLILQQQQQQQDGDKE